MYNISRDYDGLTRTVCFDQHMFGWKNLLQGKLIPDWMNIINKEREQLGLPPNLWALPQMMKALITTNLNLWQTRCEFLQGGIHSEKIIKKRRILLQQVEGLETRRHNLGQKGMDHIEGAPAEDAKCRVIWAWIRTAQALYCQANKRQKSFFRRTALPLTFDEFIRTDN